MKGAVFDWDGTLASIDEREFYCINKALAENGASPIDKDFYINNYYRRAYELGTGPRMVLKTALAARSPAIIERAIESYRRFFQGSPEKATLQTGAIEVLKALRLAGFNLGIATMRYTRWVVESEMRQLAVASLVDMLQTREDLAKPVQEWGTSRSLEEIVNQRAGLVTRVLEGLRLDHGDVFLVGDSWWDIRAGKQLQIKTVLVKTGFASYNDFSNEKPNVTVGSLLELRDILERKKWTI